MSTALLAACSPIHDDDLTALHSELDAPPTATYADPVERARPFVRAFVVDENLPGLSLAVGMAGDVVWAEGFGWADLDEQRPVTPTTLFRIGSVAMPMTATAVGVLLERGLLDLDAPVRDYVPGFPEKTWSVSTRQLMGHVAGVRHYGDDDELLFMRDHCESPLDGLGLFADDPLRFAPGTRYQYSSYGWTLVGAVVEATAGEPFLEFMQREVFDPLGMGDTEPDDPVRPAPETTSFYWPRAARDPIYGIEDANNPDTSCLQGAGALLSTPSDIVRFGLAMLGEGLLRADTLDLLRTPLELDSGESTEYGLGWFIRSAPLDPEAQTTIYGHGGSSPGGFTSFMTLPEQGIVVAITTNVSFAANLPSLSLQLARIFAGGEAAAPQRLLGESTRIDEFRPRAW
ncbi:MAG: serine hydrolase domain-containing protein [Vicinamibacterales bacterium]|nr:serine hydrolase domain-containing protein [Vicinamibacterales bacterium]